MLLDRETKCVTQKGIIPQLLIGMLVGVVLVLAVGGVYYLFASNQTVNENQSASELAPNYNNSSERDSVPSVREIHAALKELPRFQQISELYATLKETDTVELKRAFVQAESESPSFLRDEVQTAIMRRLAVVDPREGLKLIYGTTERNRELLLQELFGELSILNFEDALSIAAEVPDSQDRHAIVRGMIQSRDDLATEALVQAAKSLGVEQVALDEIAALQTAQVEHDPSSSWQKFFSVHGSDVEELSAAQFDLLTSIARTWIDRSGANAMQEIWSSLRHDRDRVQVFSRLLNSIAQYDPQMGQTIAEWLESVDRNVLAQSFAEWSASAPREALEFVQSLNLGVAQQRIERSVVESWIRNDPIAVLENLDHFTEGIRMMAELDAYRELTRTTPELVPSWIDSISDEDTKHVTIHSLVDHWAQQDPSSTLDWIMTNDSQIGPNRWSFLSTVLPILVEDEPQLALKTALEHPQTDSGVGLEALVIGGMATVDFDQAVAELSSARNQETREAAYIAIGKSLVEIGDAKRAIDLAKDLPKDRQMSYYSGFSTEWASNPEDLLENLDRFPSRDIQIMLVRETLQFDRFVRALSPEQRTELNSFMSDGEE